MSSFACPVVEVAVEEHPDADRLEVARVGGYCLVVAKGSFRTGDRAVYLPEGSVLPASLIEELGLTGRLAGKAANRVRAARLRGVVSQGLLVPLDSPHLADGGERRLGDDLAEALGVVKWEPPIPVRMQGLVEACGWPSSFDVESWQACPDLFATGEPVRVTEKLHGTFCLLGFHPEHGAAVASKGMAGKTRFVVDAPENADNLYVRAWRSHGGAIRSRSEAGGEALQVLGEIVGPKVQDLRYGLTRPAFFGFAVRGRTGMLDPGAARAVMEDLGVEAVPLVADGAPFDHDELLEAASRPSLLGGGLREGVVVQPVEQRHDPRFGRVIAKYVNPDYLLRKGGTEHN